MAVQKFLMTTICDSTSVSKAKSAAGRSGLNSGQFGAWLLLLSSAALVLDLDFVAEVLLDGAIIQNIECQSEAH